MYPRWQLDAQTSPLRPTAPPPPSRIEFASAPGLDLESQLHAELDGASWAVLAFAPEDALWADWLYRNLNGYPVPTPMIDSATSHGRPRPDCVSVFPDQRDPEYAAHYPQALEKSGYLVVVCSPRSAHCAELDAQICAFKSAGGEERIIALVVEGGPEGALEKAPKTAAPAWLPSWLRWRLQDDAFAAADAGEPRIVDARPGRASLKEVRDILLAALLDVDAWELEVTGSLAHPVEAVRAAAKAPAPTPTAPPPTPLAVLAAPRKIGSVVLTAALCVSVTLGTAWWSFGRIENDQRRPLAAPVRVVASRVVLRPAERLVAPEAPAVETAPAPDEPPAPAVAAAPTPAPRSAQVVAPPISAIQPLAPPALVPPPPAEESPARVAVVALHHRGDAAFNQRRLDEALGFYEEAVDSAAAVPDASPDARAEAAVLCRKLGTLQLQMASTAEARASFVQGRKLLLALKAHGQWNAGRAKVLSEIEVSLRRLPRD